MQVEELYKKVFYTCTQFAVYQKKDVQKNVEQLLPLLNEYADFFLTENQYGLKEEDYRLLQQLLINILQDIMQGLENRDNVLLEDTIEYGLKEFLELFIIEEQELMALREASKNEWFDL